MKINEIEDFSWPSGNLPEKKEVDWRAIRALIIALGFLAGFWWLFWTTVFPEPAKAQVITVQHCRTNEECLRLACTEETNYINVKEICGG